MVNKMKISVIIPAGSVQEKLTDLDVICVSYD